MLMKPKVAQRGFLVTAIVGLVVAGLRLLNELTTGDICPPLGPVPFCAIVLASYLPIVIYAAQLPEAPKLLFFVGGFPAVLSPIAGSLRELRSVYARQPLGSEQQYRKVVLKQQSPRNTLVC